MAYFLKINSYTSTISRALDENFGGLLAVPLLLLLCSAPERVPFKPDSHSQQNIEPNLKYVQCLASVDTKPNSKLQQKMFYVLFGKVLTLSRYFSVVSKEDRRIKKICLDQRAIIWCEYYPRRGKW